MPSRNSPTLRPVASPVDTFVAPPTATPADRLAEGLAKFVPDLLQLSSRQQEAKAQQDIAEGQQLGREIARSGQDYATAIRKGEIHPSESPWFRMGAHEQMGRAAAAQFYGDFVQALGQSDVKDATDVAAYDKFAGDYLKQWTAQHVGNSNLQFQQGFAEVDKTIADLRTRFAADAGERLVKQNLDDYEATQIANLRRLVDAGNATPEQYAAAIQAELDRQVAVGTDRKAVNEATIKAVADAATYARDARLFYVLKNVKAGSTSLYDRPDVQAVLNDTRNRILDIRGDEETARRQQEQEQLQQTVNTTFNSAIDAMLTTRTPASVDLTPYLNTLRATKGGFAYVDSLVQTQRTLASRRTEGDPRVENDLLAEIVVDPNFDATRWVRRAANALNNGSIGRDGFNALMAQIRTIQGEGTGGGPKVLTNPLFTQGLRFLRDHYGSDIVPAEVAAVRGDASRDFQGWWLRQVARPEWKSMSDLQKNEAINKRIETTFSLYTTAGAPIKDLSGNPRPDTDVNAPAWVRQPVDSPQNMERVFRAWEQSGFSPRKFLSMDGMVTLLKQNNVPPDRIPEFIRRQQALYGYTQAAAASSTR